MVRVKLVTKYPLSYCVDREKQEVTVDGKSGFVSVTGKSDVASDKFVVESEYVEVSKEMAFGRKIPTDGLIAEYTFFEGAGTVLHDTSGYDNHADIYGAVWEQLPTGKWCLTFDGKDDYCKMKRFTIIDKKIHELTIVAWVKIDRDTGNWQQIVEWKVNEAKAFDEVYLELKPSKIDFRVDDALLSANISIQFNVWLCFIGVWRRNLTLYVKGQNYDFKVTTEKEEHEVITKSVVTIGRDFEAGQHLAGSIGYLAIYTKAWSDAKVEKFYKATAPLFGIIV